MIKRRLSTDSSRSCSSSAACPDIFELKNGQIAIIGLEITQDLIDHLPVGTGCAAHERIVKIPRSVLISAIEALER